MFTTQSLGLVTYGTTAATSYMRWKFKNKVKHTPAKRTVLMYILHVDNFLLFGFLAICQRLVDSMMKEEVAILK